MLSEFSIESELIQDNYNGVEGTSVHQCEITYQGRSMEVEYTQGCYHRTPRPDHRGAVSPSEARENRKSRPNAPTLKDVLYSLVLDSESVRHGQSFEEWCGDFGYDEDSRQAERTFNACCEQWRKFNAIGADIAALSAHFEDY